MTAYGTIVADPPWRYTKTPTERLEGGSGASAEHIYPTMLNSAIAALPVRELAAPDSHLFMWVTNPVLLGIRRDVGEPDPVAIVRAWGYEPKTLLTWHKTPGLGLGFFFRGATEHVIFAVRGRLPIDAAIRESNLISAARRRHSQKPEAFMDLVERVSPGPYLELFSRSARLGWDTWGNESLGGDAALTGETDDR